MTNPVALRATSWTLHLLLLLLLTTSLASSCTSELGASAATEEAESALEQKLVRYDERLRALRCVAGVCSSKDTWDDLAFRGNGTWPDEVHGPSTIGEACPD